VRANGHAPGMDTMSTVQTRLPRNLTTEVPGLTGGRSRRWRRTRASNAARVAPDQPRRARSERPRERTWTPAWSASPGPASRSNAAVTKRSSSHGRGRPLGRSPGGPAGQRRCPARPPPPPTPIYWPGLALPAPYHRPGDSRSRRGTPRGSGRSRGCSGPPRPAESLAPSATTRASLPARLAAANASVVNCCP
jgi:hypothetical protein